MGRHICSAALFAAVSGPCLIMTLDLIIVAANQAFLDLCGRRREDVVGRNVVDLFPHGSVPGPHEAVVLLVHRAQDVTPEGPPCSRLTKLRQLNEQVRQARAQTRRLLDRQRQFAADASHGLRTPLAALRLEVEAAQRYPDDIALPDLLNHVTDGLDRLETIVDDLHLLATIESDLGRTREEVDLTVLVETVAADRWPRRHGVRLDLEPAVTVEAAPWQLTRLLAHLLDNAGSHAVHKVNVGLRRAGDHAELTVADDGKGIPRADRERVFHRFVRLDTTRSRDRGGIGLGLAIARDIAEAHRGTLNVEEAAGGGACFVLRLPLVR
ncbi:sensor histidine kinase [Nonomuraea jiangxiensis]|uniref:histidine kinase n=1 Tax=Nonomuraea jiangxiensis TaxID=633440 RepID=A0A1G8TP59_9ACTN|nr:HAMP domain-containing sensor histidine kinase [Nonomuraea jiangxiensis]SDJ43194.1 Signal transduction histidine kinase [Nonomuraea jiangxiensis]